MGNIFNGSPENFEDMRIWVGLAISATVTPDSVYIFTASSDTPTYAMYCATLDGFSKWNLKIDVEKWPYPIPKKGGVRLVKQNAPPLLPVMPRNDKLLINSKHVFTAPGYIDEIIYHHNHIYLHYDGPPSDYRNICCLDESGKLLWFAGEAFSDGRYQRMLMFHNGFFTGGEELIGVGERDVAIHIDHETGKVLGRELAKMI